MTNETAPARIWATYNDAFGINWKDGQFTTLEQPADGRYTPYVRADALEAVQAEIQRCHKRLEITHVFKMRDENSGLERVEIPYEERRQQPDGIECRDATIALLEQSNKAAQARIAELEGECSRRAALIPIAYGEGIVDAFARGATIENSSEKFEGSDVKAALADPEIHRSEWPDNYDNAMARAALEGKG